MIVSMTLTITAEDADGGPLPTADEIVEMVQAEVSTWEFTKVEITNIEETK